MDRTVRAALCLALGAATTVGVAWALAVRVVVPITGPAYLVREGTVPDRAGGGRWWCAVKARPGMTAVVWELDHPPARSGPPRDMPHWARGPDPRQVEAIGTVRAESARGWPFRALWYEVGIRGTARRDLGGLAVPAALEWIGPGRVLPFRPIVPGLVADAAIFAALWYGAMLVPAALRRALRRAGGCCAQCGYDLRCAAGRCPECGAGLDGGRDARLAWGAWRNRSPSPWSEPGSWAARTPTRGSA
jgi:hypothetical protein